jgi:hypothetical protein
VTSDELICPQCGGEDIRVEIHPEPYAGPAIGRVEALCVLCGRRVTALIPPASKPQEPADVTPGNGAYIIVTRDRTYYGAIEAKWSNMHDDYFRQVLECGEAVCARVTRWDTEEEEPVVVYSVGDPDAIADLMRKKVEAK